MTGPFTFLSSEGVVVGFDVVIIARVNATQDLAAETAWGRDQQSEELRYRDIGDSVFGSSTGRSAAFYGLQSVQALGRGDQIVGFIGFQRKGPFGGAAR